MKKGKIIGTIVSTRKSVFLTGDKLKLVSIIGKDENPTGEIIVAKDNLDADTKNIVMISFGSGARNALKEDAQTSHLVEAAISAILE